MKKSYSSPALQVLLVEDEDILTMSNGDTQDLDEDSSNAANVNAGGIPNL